MAYWRPVGWWRPREVTEAIFVRREMWSSTRASCHIVALMRGERSFPLKERVEFRLSNAAAIWNFSASTRLELAGVHSAPSGVEMPRYSKS